MINISKYPLILLLLCSAVFVLFVESCKHDPELFEAPDPGPPDPNPVVCDTTNLTYSDVATTLSENCYSCHNSNTSNGGVDLTKYETVTFLAANGILSGVVNHESGYKPMPPAGKLDSCSLIIINKWINDTTIDDPGGGNGHPCDPDTVYFENEILPLIISSCATTDCHGLVNPEDDIILVDYASIIENGKIKPGDPDGSKLFKVITEDEPQDRMPPEPNEALSSDQVDKIKTWIEQGALNNYCDDDCDTTSITFSGNVWPIVNNKCFGCHSGSNPGGNIFLRNYADVLTVAENGKLWGAVNHQAGYSPMPKNLPKLSECELAVFRIWMEEGSLDN